jgi:hypothetical protein
MGDVLAVAARDAAMALTTSANGSSGSARLFSSDWSSSWGLNWGGGRLIGGAVLRPGQHRIESALYCRSNQWDVIRIADDAWVCRWRRGSGSLARRSGACGAFSRWELPWGAWNRGAGSVLGGTCGSRWW